MNYDFPYDHVTLHAFEYLYQYERKNFLKIDELKAFHKSIIKSFIDSYQNVEEYVKVREGDNYRYKKCLISCDVSFNEYDEDKEMERFLRKYRRYFKVSDDTIYFDGTKAEDELTYQYWELQDEALRPVWGRFCELFQKKTEVLRNLGIHSVEDFLCNYIKIENDIRQAYQEFVIANDCVAFEKKVGKKILIRNIFIKNLYSLDTYFNLPFRNLAGVLAHNYDGCGHFAGQGFIFATGDVRREDERLSYLKVIDIIEYAVNSRIRDERTKSADNPVNLGERFLKRHNLQMKIQQFAGDFDDDDELVLEEESAAPLDLLASKVNDISNDQAYEDVVAGLGYELLTIFNSGKEPSDVEDFGKQYGYYLLYLDKLNKYMMEYGETKGLLKTKGELLYLLDRGDNFIYKEENFKRELETFMNIAKPEDYRINYAYIDGHQFMAFSSDEEREGILSDSAVKYALNFATQYELTHDEAMKDKFEKYKGNKDYPLIYKIVFGVEKGKIKKRKGS